MGFINWQNLKKYIRRGTDAEVARIGHVNAVYDALSGQTPLPTRVVTTIMADGNGPYSDEVGIGISSKSSIGTDYNINVTDDGSGFSLGVNVPYHEVIGTISFPDNIGTANPTLGIKICTTIGSGSSEWSIAYQSTVDGAKYVLSFAGNSALYRDGFLITTPLQGTDTSGPYHLLPLSAFGGASIDIAFVEDYISGLGIRRHRVDIADNIAVTFQFHLILPKNV